MIGMPGRPVSPGMTRWFAVVGAVTVAVVAAGSTLGLTLRDRLPVEVASHYGTDGVDDTQPLGTYLLVAGVAIVGLTLLLGGLAALLPGDGRRFLAVTQVGMTGFVGTMLYGSLLTQRGLADAHQAPSPGPWMGLGVPVGAALAAASWPLVRPAPPPPRRPPLPQDAPRIPVSDAERLVWARRIPSALGAKLTAALAATSAVVVAVMVEPWVAVIPALVVVGLLAVLLSTLTVDADGVRVRSPARLTWVHVPVDQVTSASAERISPMRQFGGYGLRYVPSGRAFVTRAGPALRLDTQDGTSTWVSVDDPEGAAAVVNTLLDRRPASAPEP